MENIINEEVPKKRAVKFYLLFHVNFHLSTVTFLTDPPAVLSIVLMLLKCITRVICMLHCTDSTEILPLPLKTSSSVDLDRF